MIENLYRFPKSAEYGKIIPKSKIYEHSSISSKLKELFVREVEKIVWSYKLSPQTINLEPTENVKEIQIITIYLKTSEISIEVLQSIDKAIPSPIIFEIIYNNKIKYIAAYKRPSLADKTKRVISSYLQSEWINDKSEKDELPVVFNLDSLYKIFLTELSCILIRDYEKLEDFFSRLDEINSKKKEAEKIEARMRKEKQFKVRVELNRKLNNLKIEISELKK